MLSAIVTGLALASSPVVELDLILHPDCQLDGEQIHLVLIQELPEATIFRRFDDGLLHEDESFISLQIRARPGARECAVAILTAEGSRKAPGDVPVFRHHYLDVTGAPVGASQAVALIASAQLGLAIQLDERPSSE